MPSRWFIEFVLAAILITACTLPTWGQNQPSAGQPSNPQVASAPTLGPATIPNRVLTGQQLVRELSPLAASDVATPDLEQDLQANSTRISNLLDDFESEGTHTRSRRSLDDLRAETSSIRADLRSWQNRIGDLSSRIGDALGQIGSELTAWQTSRQETWFDSLPDELDGQVRTVEADLRTLRTELERRLGDLLEVQTQVSESTARLGQLSERIDTEVGSRNRDMLAVDSPPIWRVVLHPQGVGGFGREIGGTISQGLEDVRAYAAGHTARLGIQILAWILLVVILEASRRRSRQNADTAEPSSGLAIVRRPVAAATLLVLTIGEVLLHRHAPSAWYDVVILLVLAGAARLLPVLLPPTMQRVLRWLALIALLHWAAYLVSERLSIDRILWFLVTLIGAVMLPRLGAWTYAAISAKRPRLAAAERLLARLCAVALAVATLANIFGAFSLTILLADGSLVTIYLSVLMWTLTEIVDGLVALLLSSRLGQRTHILREHGHRVRDTTSRLTGFVALVGWATGSASVFEVLTPSLKMAQAVLTTSVTVGQISISAGTVLLFGLVIWLSFKLSRFLRFVLAEEVFDRVELPQGVPGALSTLTHYIVLVIGFLIAVAAVGLDLTKFALIAGALGVGIGFGLQTVVNNFVSGLLLLFERPIRIGDKVQLGQMSGTVTTIGIRASTIRTWDGAEVIVPNGSLLESELVNWTLSDATRRIEVRVGVAYGTDPEEVLHLLEGAARSHSRVLASPEPQALFIGFGDSALDFSLRAWCRFEDMIEVASDLHVAVNRSLAEAGIEIPFPQRDLHLRTAVPGDLLRQPGEADD